MVIHMITLLLNMLVQTQKLKLSVEKTDMEFLNKLQHHTWEDEDVDIVGTLREEIL